MPSGDAYRVVLLALGVGLVAAAAAVEIATGAGSPPVVGQVATYFVLLVASLPALPAVGLALAGAAPSRPGPRALRPWLAWPLYAVSPLWHVSLLEVCLRLSGEPSFLARRVVEVGAAYAAFTPATALAWLACVRRRRAPPPPVTPRA